MHTALGQEKCSDAARFLRSWLDNPLRTAAVAPSSRSLADLMTRHVDASIGAVVELGPGTGVFTRALLERGVAAEHLTVLESNPEFVNLLRARFPGASVVHADAARDPWPHNAQIGAVVSGLPLLSMSAEDVMAVFASAFVQIRPGGAFYQFTYAMQCPVPKRVLDALRLQATLVGRTMRNLPPAAVYRIEARSDATTASGTGSS
ncbi:MAG: methyltransferase domain-containing protein [Mycobacterium sp.]